MKYSTHLQTAWSHLRRSPYQTLAAILVLTLNFFIMTIFILVAGGAEKTLRQLESQPQVIAFFLEPPNEAELAQLQAQLIGTGKVKQMHFINQEEALQKYREDNKDNPLLLEMVTADILPASIEVSTSEPAALKQIAEILDAHEKIEEVIYQKDVIEQLVKWTKFLRALGSVLISVLAITTFLTIFIIIGLKVVIRREEVEISKLLGASPAYIRWPFVIEGSIYGMVGATLGWGITYITLLYSTPYMIDLLWSMKLLPVPVIMMIQLLGLEIFTSGLWCALAAAWAVNRYLQKRV